ncbi:MAG: 1-deoxy-D-xylulose-5-phosphate reductoisomerase [Ruminococcaceae bacterium]|nr:1-deoxy-D-xylulose-5-phosphate reductoisomerase [Oscillospiraceae bacterium]
MAEYTDRRLSLLGSTGSIGTQALDVARCLGIRVEAMAARRNVSLLEQQIREFSPSVAAVMEEDAAADLRVRVADLPVKVLSGMDGFRECAALESCDTVLNSVVGMVGLVPTLTAIEAGKRIALANKETLVAGGRLVMDTAARYGVDILPVDSEHSAIFQSLQGSPGDHAVRKIILTASGGPFFGMTKEQLAAVKKEQALRHPNWDMGQKITIDSATLMNKGLEVIEAAWLFGKTVDEIEVVVHRQSIIHSAVEYCDGSVIAQLGLPDMRIPIQYAITWPDRAPSPAKPLSLTEIGQLTFAQPDTENFRCLEICRQAMRRGGLCPCAANGANEAAVDLFLHDRISFPQIAELVGEAMERQAVTPDYTLEDVLEADRAARRFVCDTIS